MIKTIYKSLPLSSSYKNAILFGILSFLLFILTSLETYSFTHDGIPFLATLKRSLPLNTTILFHPHHFIIDPIYKFLFNIFTLSTDIPSHLILLRKWINTISFSITLIGAHLIFSTRFKCSPKLSTIGSSSILFSFIIWAYASSLEIYGLSVCFGVWTLFFILKDTISKKELILIGILNSLAILCHISYVLLGPILLFRLWLQHKKSFFSYFITYCLVTGIVISLCYGLYILNAFQTNQFQVFPGDILKWLQTQEGLHYSLSLKKLILHPLIAFFKAIFGGYFLFSILPFQTFLARIFPKNQLNDDFFITRDLSSTNAFILTIIILILCISILIVVINSIKHYKQKKYPNIQKLSLIIASFLLFNGLAFYANPQNTDFYIFQVFLFWIILFVMANSLPSKTIQRLVLIPFCLGLINFSGNIYFLMDKQNDYFYRYTQTINEFAKPNDIFISDYHYYISSYITLFTPIQNIIYLNKVTEPLSQNLHKTITTTLSSGHNVFVLDSAIVLSSFSKARYDTNQNELDLIWNLYKKHWKKHKVSTRQSVYEISSNLHW